MVEWRRSRKGMKKRRKRERGQERMKENEKGRFRRKVVQAWRVKKILISMAQWQGKRGWKEKRDQTKRARHIHKQMNMNRVSVRQVGWDPQDHVGGKRGLVERGLEEILYCMKSTEGRCCHITWRWGPSSRETWDPRSLCLSKVALVGPPQCMHVPCSNNMCWKFLSPKKLLVSSSINATLEIELFRG